jgi:hypothetical protein
MKRLFSEYKRLFKNKAYKKSLLIGIFLLLLAAIASSLAIDYANNISGNYMGDLILDNIPTLSLFWFRTFGISLITLSIIILILSKPRYLPTSLKSISLMYLIRTFFLVVTHLKFYPDKIAIPTDYPIFGGVLSPGNDLFFSGHVALPFLVSLIFWDNKKIRYSFIFIAVICGIAALLAKTHYSIDVFAAPFITYTVFKISERLFKKDLKYINGGKE